MKKVLIAYWTMTGNTEMMANAMAEALADADVTCVNVSSDTPAIEGYDYYLFGCSAMGDEILDDTEFDPYFTSIESGLDGKPVALFGSYDWGDGQWMRDWQDRVKADGANLFEEGLILQLMPDDEGLQTCKDFAKRFVG